MSASEKLRALAEREQRELENNGIGHGRVWLDCVDDLWAALPQIVAVVEAGERYESAWSGYGVGLHDQSERIEEALRDLRAALTALEEALS